MLTPELLMRKMITKETFKRKIDKENINLSTKYHQCFSKKIYIDTQFNVYPCVMERRICHGNIKNMSIKDVISDEIIKLNKDKIEGCKICEFRYACFDCRADSIDDNICAKPYYCTYNPQNGTWENQSEFLRKFFCKET